MMLVSIFVLRFQQHYQLKEPEIPKSLWVDSVLVWQDQHQNTNPLQIPRGCPTGCISLDYADQN